MAYLAAECDPDVASAMGLRFVDHDVKPGEYYEYILQCNIPIDLVDVEDPSAVVFCGPFIRSEEEDMPEITITQLDEHRLALRWDKNRLSGYYVDRSQDGGSSWSRLNVNAPIWPMIPDSVTVAVYGDTVAQWMENQVVYFDSVDIAPTYIYRVRAFDAFGGETGWRQSDPFKMLDLIPPTEPMIHVIVPEQNRICKIEWSKAENEADLVGFVVTFSSTLEGPWVNVSGQLPTTARSYTDSTADKLGRGYYRVFASDTAGNTSYSGAMLNHIEDILPPDPLKGFRAIASDTSELVYMEWHRNLEPDLLAYKVYFANQTDHEFIECSKGYWRDTMFLDTVELTSLTREIFYYVIAVDNNHNFSKPSDTVRVLLPDFIAPGVCVLENVWQDNDTVTITWRGSVSTDVDKYLVYRKPREAANWECIDVLAPEFVNEQGLIVYGERLTPSPHAYSYCIEAIDSSLNSSGFSGFAVVFVSEPAEVDVNIKLKASYSGKKGVELSWSHDYKGKKNYYGIVYRKENEGAWRDIATLTRTDKTYIDNQAPKGTQCSYYIEYQLGKGKHSKPSNVVSVNVK